MLTKYSGRLCHFYYLMIKDISVNAYIYMCPTLGIIINRSTKPITVVELLHKRLCAALGVKH